MRFPSARGNRGNRDDGVNIILNLEKENPRHPEVLFAASNYRFGEGFIEEAKNGYLEVLKIDPGYKNAKESLEIIELDEKKLKIRNVSFLGNRKTSEKRLLKKTSEYSGTILDQDSRFDICSKLMEISSINGVSIKGSQFDDIYVDLEITVTEESSKILMFQQVTGAGLDIDNNILPSGLMPPVTVFIDNNLFRTGSRLMYITVFVYNQLDLYVPGLINDKYLDFSLNISSMLFANPNLDETNKSSYHVGKVGLGRTFPFNLSTFIYYQSRFDIYEKLGVNITPNHLITHSESSDITFNSAGDATTPFNLLEGMLFSFNPTINYKQDYKAWGDPESLTTHDDNVSLVFLTRLGYYKNLNPKNNISILGSWFINYNPYDSDHFALGHKGDVMTLDSLTGYLPEEIIFDNGILINIKHTITPKSNKVNLYAKYNVLFDIDNTKFYNGVALGGAVKLPWNIDLKGEFGIGLNAIRENGPGLFLSLELSKFMIF